MALGCLMARGNAQEAQYLAVRGAPILSNDLENKPQQNTQEESMRSHFPKWGDFLMSTGSPLNRTSCGDFPFPSLALRA